MDAGVNGDLSCQLVISSLKIHFKSQCKQGHCLFSIVANTATFQEVDHSLTTHFPTLHTSVYVILSDCTLKWITLSAKHYKYNLGQQYSKFMGAMNRKEYPFMYWKFILILIFITPRAAELAGVAASDPSKTCWAMTLSAELEDHTANKILPSSVLHWTPLWWAGQHWAKTHVSFAIM